jgi:hypothetical protein
VDIATLAHDASRLRPRLRRARHRAQADQALPSVDQRPGREHEPYGQRRHAITKAFHYETAESLRAHVQAFLSACNFAEQFKALRWRTPFQAICESWKANPTRFKINPRHLHPGTKHLVTGVVAAGRRSDHDWWRIVGRRPIGRCSHADGHTRCNCGTWIVGTSSTAVISAARRRSIRRGAARTSHGDAAHRTR